MAQTNRLKRTLLLVGALLVIIAVHTLSSSMFADMKDNNAAQAEQAELYEESSVATAEPSTTEESTPINEESFSAQLPTAYKAYSIKGFKEAWQVMTIVAEDIYQQELAEGDTDDEFELSNYIIKAIDSHDERMTSSVQLSLLLPLLLAVMVVIAIFVSIKSGLAAIRPLSFDNDASVFNN